MGLMWVLLVAGSLAAGILVVGVLVSHTSLELPIAMAGLACLTGSTYALSRLVSDFGADAAALWGLAFMLASAGGGYALASTLLYLLAQPRPLPELPDHFGAASERPAVFLVACSEPETYHPGATAQMLQSLSDEGLLEVSVGTLPLIFFAQKTRYRAVGGSNPAHRQVAAIAERLSGTLKDVMVKAVRCTGPLSLARAAADAALSGHRTIVVAELSVGEPVAMATAMAQLEALKLPHRGIAVRHTGVLWCSERIIGMLAARVMNATTDPSTTGVVLVGHGQPEEITRKNPEMDENETSFLHRLRMALIEDGLTADNVRVAWADWGEPDITSAVRHLAALGCTRVIVEPAAFPYDSIATRLDLELAVRQARLNEGAAATVTLSVWKDDPAVVEELRSRIVNALQQPQD